MRDSGDDARGIIAGIHVNDLGTLRRGTDATHFRDGDVVRP